ncbi:MAG: DUF3455 domain-containing protein [Acidobacteriaceae bacterium]|nr:DUF3455 domain-containing protein [Acidobacteriaceae bacterium]
MRFFCPVVCLWSAAVCAFAQDPATPPQLTPPPASKLVFHARGRGEQIYSCTNVQGRYEWKLKAPRADLYDTNGAYLGKHFAGPTWEAKDGSHVAGKATATVQSPKADAIPWLLVTAVGNDGDGIMSRVSSIQRLNTQGGKAPGTGCDPAHDGAETSVPYEADYYFYTNAQRVEASR